MRRVLLAVLALAIVVAAALLAAGDAPTPRADPVERSAISPPRLRTEPEPIPVEFMPAPFPSRNVQRPDPRQPPPSETAAYCDERNWSRLDLGTTRVRNGEFRVDEAAWNRALTETKAGLASFLSLCHADGGTITLIAAVSGETLASYHPASGLRLAGR